MKIVAIKTQKIIPGRDKNLLGIFDRYLPRVKEGSVLVVTSKIVSICEGRVVKMGEQDKDDLVRQEAEYYLPREENKYNFFLTMKDNLLLPTAGIDESNGNGYYILWPSNPQKTANEVRAYLKERFKLRRVGVMITDSKTTPLRWGVTGVAVAQSGFAPLRDLRGKPDVFGRKLKVTQVNIADALAAAAVVVMGEGKEQTPLAVIEDIPFVQFQNRSPSTKELRELHIRPEDDLYAPLLTSVTWRRGKSRTD